MKLKDFNKIPKKQQIERWRQAARVLKGLSRHERRKHWNMSFFGLKTECGTVACAAGHCGIDPWFQRRGLILKFKGTEATDKFGEDVHRFFGDGVYGRFYNPSYRTVRTVIKEINQHIRELEQA